MRQNYLKYIEIKEQTYDVFNFHHHQALINIFKDDISAKDLSIITAIARNKNITPGELMQITGFSAPNLSNRLNLLESQGFLIRSKQDKDMRKHTITLSSKADKLIAEYNNYVTGFITFIKKHLLFSEKITFFNFLNRWWKAKNREEKNSENKDMIPGLILDDIQNFFLTNETIFIDELEKSFNYADLLFLSELYINEIITKRTLPKLADYLLMPYQTVISKVKRFVEEGYIVRENKKIIFSNETIRVIDHFIFLRTRNFYEALLGSSLKEYNAIIKVFYLLKKYADSFNQ